MAYQRSMPGGYTASGYGDEEDYQDYGDSDADYYDEEVSDSRELAQMQYQNPIP